MNGNGRIVLLCEDGDSTRAVCYALRKTYGAGNLTVIMENPISRKQMAKGRVKKLGFLKVAGQILFVALVVPMLNFLSRRRIAEIEKSYDLSDGLSDGSINIIRVDTVNSEETREALRKIQPKVVVVNATRIIGKKTLQSVSATFINTHAGITPLYRGVHGAYWALAEGKPELVGTTVHLVDEGIDTGKVIGQAFFEVSEADNFATYPYLHTAYALPILLDAVEDALQDDLKPKENILNLPSKLRYHPTIWEYFIFRFFNGVK